MVQEEMDAPWACMMASPLPGQALALPPMPPPPPPPGYVMNGPHFWGAYEYAMPFGVGCGHVMVLPMFQATMPRPVVSKPERPQSHQSANELLRGLRWALSELRDVSVGIQQVGYKADACMREWVMRSAHRSLGSSGNVYLVQDCKARRYLTSCSRWRELSPRFPGMWVVADGLLMPVTIASDLSEIALAVAGYLARRAAGRAHCDGANCARKSDSLFSCMQVGCSKLLCIDCAFQDLAAADHGGVTCATCPSCLGPMFGKAERADAQAGQRYRARQRRACNLHTFFASCEVSRGAVIEAASEAGSEAASGATSSPASAGEAASQAASEAVSEVASESAGDGTGEGASKSASKGQSNGSSKGPSKGPSKGKSKHASEGARKDEGHSAGASARASARAPKPDSDLDSDSEPEHERSESSKGSPASGPYKAEVQRVLQLDTMHALDPGQSLRMRKHLDSSSKALSEILHAAWLESYSMVGGRPVRSFIEAEGARVVGMVKRDKRCDSPWPSSKQELAFAGRVHDFFQSRRQGELLHVTVKTLSTDGLEKLSLWTVSASPQTWLDDAVLSINRVPREEAIWYLSFDPYSGRPKRMLPDVLYV